MSKMFAIFPILPLLPAPARLSTPKTAPRRCPGPTRSPRATCRSKEAVGTVRR